MTFFSKPTFFCQLYLVMAGFALLATNQVDAGIHNVPIILTAQHLGPIQYHPIKMYRLFRTGSNGEAIAIPFQIDERDQYGDFILPQGRLGNELTSNQIFDGLDELSFMGNDVGPVRPPKKWPGKEPAAVFEIRFNRENVNGAVYVGLYFDNPPPLSPLRYVNFDLPHGQVLTSRYRYRFDPKNYLVVDGIDIVHRDGSLTQIIDSSTFFLSIDLRYFLTISINHSDIRSDLEAYKVGPVRTITRVIFSYQFLRMNFDLGMYTEVSFFSNSVVLPAVIDNPLDGNKSLNKGSIFYYGLLLRENPANYKIDSNMPPFGDQSKFLSLFTKPATPLSTYFVEAQGKDQAIFMDITLSPQMIKNQCLPMIYLENLEGEKLQSRPKSAQPLGKSRANVAIALDMVNLDKAEHNIAFRLYIENHNNPSELAEFKTANDWQVVTNRIDR